MRRVYLLSPTPHLVFTFSEILMAQLDNDVNVEEVIDDVNHTVLSPALSLTTSKTMVNSQKRKNGNASFASTPRGRAWREKDSVLLVKAYVWVEETKRGTVSFFKLKANQRQRVTIYSRLQYVQALVISWT